MNTRVPDFDTNPDKEWKTMWQESAVPQPDDPAAIARTMGNAIRQFDRRIFWRNAREYAACGIMLILFAIAAVRRSSLVPAPLLGMAAVAFVMACLWWRHRGIEPLDPAENARAFQTALLARYDRQLRLLRSARYWYFLPLYIWILTATIINLLHRPARVNTGAHVIGLALGLCVVTAVFSRMIRLNERGAASRIAEAKKQLQ